MNAPERRLFHKVLNLINRIAPNAPAFSLEIQSVSDEILVMLGFEPKLRAAPPPTGPNPETVMSLGPGAPEPLLKIVKKPDDEA